MHCDLHNRGDEAHTAIGIKKNQSDILLPYDTLLADKTAIASMHCATARAFLDCLPSPRKFGRLIAILAQASPSKGVAVRFWTNVL